MYGLKPLHNSWAASAWPTAQMSSRSSSTVNSAVRLIAAGSTRRPRHSKLAKRQSMLLKHGAYRLKIEFSGQIHDGAIFIVEQPDCRHLLSLAIGEMAEQVELGFDMALEIHAHKGGELHKPRVD